MSKQKILLDGAVDESGVSRRDFLAFSKRFLLSATALTLSPFSLSAKDIDAAKLVHLDTKTSLLIAEVSRLMFPHSELADTVYLEITRDVDVDVDADLAANKGEHIIQSIAEKLGANWAGLSEQKKLDLLTSKQGEPWFGYLRNRTIESLYRHPAVWELVGYQGSSIEKGGYLNRGFDDIDWLEDVQ